MFVLVGVRLWADNKRQTIPFPNFIATSAREAAVAWGKEIYFLDHEGKFLRKQGLPEEVLPTQLKYVGDELWIGDYARQTISRVKSDGLETVVNGSGRFRGAFKFVVDLRTEEIFVTDSSNHKVHLFAMDGRHLKSFGEEGKGPGELMFPNTLVFDAQGRLLIVNTNAQRLDIFERNGRFVETFAPIAPQGRYRFPTLLAQVGDRFALLLTVDLMEAKGLVYGADGKYVGELPAPKEIGDAGDVGAWEGKILVSDRMERRVYCFSSDTLAYLGPFSAHLDALGAEAFHQEAFYGQVADAALYLLLAACLPLVILYLRLRNADLKAALAFDYRSLVPEEALMATVLGRRKLIAGLILWALSVLCVCIQLTGWLKSFPLNLALLLSAGLLMFLGSLYYMKSGFTDPGRRKILELLLKALRVKLSGALLPGEQVESCVALRSSAWSGKISLLLCTDRRMLIIDPSVKTGGMTQVGYGNIDSLSLEPVTFALQPLLTLLKNLFFTLSLSASTDGGATTLHFTGTDRALLERVRDLVQSRRAGGERLDRMLICDGCFRPMRKGGCPECASGKKQNWTPLILSCIYPGLGQFYNRELIRGTLLSAAFTAGALSLMIPVTKMMNRSAEFTSFDVSVVVESIAALLFLYTVSFLDADQVARKGRKLFSAATGDALTAWLQERIARLRPSSRKALVELLPGLPHALAGSYGRGALFLVPTIYIFWTTSWSLMSILTEREVNLDLYLFGCGAAVTAILWVWMNVDGLRLLRRGQPLQVTGKGISSIFIPPLLTAAGATIVQLGYAKLIWSNPARYKTVHTSFYETHRFVVGNEGFAGFLAQVPGWGGAVMALFAVIAWQSGKPRGTVLRGAFAGLLAGVFCWSFCALLLGGALGGVVLTPVAFGASLGLAVYLYVRNDGASPLLVPAIMAGTIVGHIVMIASLPLVFSSSWIIMENPAALAAVTVVTLVAIPVYFIHLAYQLLTAALGRRTANK